ncbi:geranylgeranyl reductase family [Shimia gijangensis]|uniref:Geranylgeranyl reductase family n=1 Tax=Shimia gijangensis TaxID=1470563 RepID=A0A1M6GX98_9RHOB|nr:geranylgeranyl reductase family protein [Shimia gijangensis]SHJ14571.1 geranylgeranyl reductase family [Shimia gijangensis]
MRMDQTNSPEFDIIVIGAGPAGSAAASRAARHGATVALVDKASFPRTKLCGGLFTERSHQTYCKVFDRQFDFSHAVTRREIEFWHDNKCLSSLPDVPPMHLTMRIDLDKRLFTHAIEDGAHDFSGKSIASLDGTDVTFRDGCTIRGRVLIGADGVNSITARALFGAPFDKSTIGFGLEVEVAPDEQIPTEQPLRVDFGAANWGYGWSFPKQGSTTVGVGGLLNSNPDMKGQFSTYLKAQGLDHDPRRFKGHYLPFGDFRVVPGRGAVLLAGDAAGLVDPITGEGIALAMESGHLAARAALDAINASAPETALDRYQVALKDMHRSLRIARGIRRIVFAPGWQQTFVGAFRRSGTLRTQYLQLLAGQVEYPELARNMLRRLPRLVVNRLGGHRF